MIVTPLPILGICPRLPRMDAIGGMGRHRRRERQSNILGANGIRNREVLLLSQLEGKKGSVVSFPVRSGIRHTGLDWPLCHGTGAPFNSTNTGAPWPLTGNITGNYQ